MIAAGRQLYDLNEKLGTEASCTEESVSVTNHRSDFIRKVKHCNIVIVVDKSQHDYPLIKKREIL